MVTEEAQVNRKEFLKSVKNQHFVHGDDDGLAGKKITQKKERGQPNS